MSRQDLTCGPVREGEAGSSRMVYVESLGLNRRGCSRTVCVDGSPRASGHPHAMWSPTSAHLCAPISVPRRLDMLLSLSHRLGTFWWFSSVDLSHPSTRQPGLWPCFRIIPMRIPIQTRGLSKTGNTVHGFQIVLTPNKLIF